MIALQVAAGIVLAYVIIVNQTLAIKVAKVAGAVLLFCILAAIAFYIVAIAMVSISDAIGPRLSPKFDRLMANAAVGAIVALAFASGAIGGYCLSLVTYKLKGIEPPDDAEDHPFFRWSLLNLLFTVGVLGLLSLTPLDILGPIDAWSRDNGYKDGGSIVLLSVLLPWPALWLWLLAKRQPDAHSVKTNPEDK